LQNALFASNSILAENVNDRVVIRSLDCEYAVEMVRNVHIYFLFYLSKKREKPSFFRHQVMLLVVRNVAE